MKFYADGIANIEEHSTYLSFVISAVNEITALLPICGIADADAISQKEISEENKDGL